MQQSGPHLPAQPGPRARRGLRALRRAAMPAAVCAVVAALVWVFLPPVPLLPPGTGFSGVVTARDGSLLHLSLAPDGRYRLRADLDQISPHLIAAVLRMEDRHFYRHPGVNPASLARAALAAATGRKGGGGSTITMQLARLRFRLDTRSVAGKCAQIARAIQLERHYSKRQIFEAYLTLAPYGGNVEGAEAAALIWCGKPARDLTAREAAALAVLPQSPARRKPRAGSANPALAAAQHRLWTRLGAGRRDPLDAEFALRPPGPVPRGIPHLARRLLAAAPGGRAASTIDPAAQRAVERAIGSFLALRRGEGVRNACALLVDAASREVLAYAGSAGFLDETIQGQVDGVTARRSPGSALKPFIYALAMDQGLIHPQSLLRDARGGFGEFNPENFDRAFSGPVSAADALYHSRNIPAVDLAARLGAEGGRTLFGFLKAAGVALPRDEAHYGLALPLGGAEISMEEMGRLYALLADDGRPRPLRFVMDGGKRSGFQAAEPVLLSPAGRFLTLQMLRPPPEEDPAPGLRLCWKTGTSHGFRDAWAAGVAGGKVLVVWVGNFDGSPNPAFVARDTAAPLLLACAQALRLEASAEPPPPAEVVETEFCAVSGSLPSPHCPHRKRGWFAPGVSPISPCAVHREVLIDNATGLRVLTDDGTRDLRREVFEFWPADLLALFRDAGLPRREPPPLEPGAQALAAALANEAPEITSPREALVYTLRSGDEQRNRIALEARAAPGTRKLFWFADGALIGSADPGSPLFWRPAPGARLVHVCDDQGRSSSRRIRVEQAD